VQGLGICPHKIFQGELRSLPGRDGLWSPTKGQTILSEAVISGDGRMVLAIVSGNVHRLVLASSTKHLFVGWIRLREAHKPV